MKRIYFTGFASGHSENNVHDYELIVQDLLNHIYTRKGERLMNPNYGSIVWDLIFELKSNSIATEIRDDLIAIIQSDPRVKLVSINIGVEEHGYIANIILNFNTLNVVKKLTMDFNKQINNIENVE